MRDRKSNTETEREREKERREIVRKWERKRVKKRF